MVDVASVEGIDAAIRSEIVGWGSCYVQTHVGGYVLYEDKKEYECG